MSDGELITCPWCDRVTGGAFCDDHREEWEIEQRQIEATRKAMPPMFPLPENAVSAAILTPKRKWRAKR